MPLSAFAIAATSVVTLKKPDPSSDSNVGPTEIRSPPPLESDSAAVFDSE